MEILKENNINPEKLIVELHKRNQDGSYMGTTKVIGPYTFKTNGHFAQSVVLYAKKTDSDDSHYVYIYSVSDH
jgi:hypothetical protein